MLKGVGMINVGVIGATGYTGEELISILLKHPQVRITYLAAKIDKPTSIAKIFPKFKNRIELICEPPNIDSAISICNLLFLALPHTVSMDVAPRFLQANKRVIDLSADYRLTNTKVYEKFYKAKHSDVENLKSAVYGLPEIYRTNIKTARLVANPGCYPTAAILGLAPLIACETIKPETIIIDAKYKRQEQNADYYQVIAYALAIPSAKACFLVYPSDETIESEPLTLDPGKFGNARDEVKLHAVKVDLLLEEDLKFREYVRGIKDQLKRKLQFQNYIN